MSNSDNNDQLNDIQLEILFNKMYNICKSDTFIENKDHIKTLLKNKFKLSEFPADFFIEEKSDDLLLQKKNIDLINHLSNKEIDLIDNITNTIIEDTNILKKNKYSIEEELNNLRKKIEQMNYNNSSKIQSSSIEIKNSLTKLENNIMSDMDKISKYQEIINYCDNILYNKNESDNIQSSINNNVESQLNINEKIDTTHTDTRTDTCTDTKKTELAKKIDSIPDYDSTILNDIQQLRKKFNIPPRYSSINMVNKSYLQTDKKHPYKNKNTTTISSRVPPSLPPRGATSLYPPGYFSNINNIKNYYNQLYDSKQKIINNDYYNQQYYDDIYYSEIEKQYKAIDKQYTNNTDNRQSTTIPLHLQELIKDPELVEVEIIDKDSGKIIDKVDLRKQTPLEDRFDTLNDIFKRIKKSDEEKKKLTPKDRYTVDEIEFYQKQEIKKKDKIDIIENNIVNLNKSNIPLRFKILASKIPLKNKAVIINKLDDLHSCRLGGSSEIPKYHNWINSLLKIPFGKYSELDINKDSGNIKIADFLNNSMNILNKAVYGHKETKDTIIELLAQWISNPKSGGNMIALGGSPGTGKTCIIKNGVAKALQRPFIFISLGGASDASYLNGHSFTYEGSTYGKIIDLLIQSQYMNPVIYFDELDKISETNKGEEIMNILVHLTDVAQNEHFNDRYFPSIPIDLSRCLFVFSYNDPTKINPILLDRLTVINVEDFNINDKIKIAQQYLIPEILNTIGIDKDSILFTEEIIKYIIEKYTCKEAGGVRGLKKCLFKILSKINLLILTQNYELINEPSENNPIKFTEKIIDTIIIDKTKEDKDPSLQHMYI